MAKFCGIMSLLLFVTNVAIHLATYIPAVPVSMHLVWPFHLATMAAFATMVIHLVMQRKRHSIKPVKGFFANWYATSQHEKKQQAKMYGFIPRSIRMACWGIVIYVFVNFALSALLYEGSPSVKKGGYYLHNHGERIRDITSP